MKISIKKLGKITSTFVPLVILIVIAFYLGFWEGSKIGYQAHWPKPLEKILNKNKPVDIPAGDMSIFWEVWQNILAKYVGRANLNTQQMIEGATSGLVESLKDPYSEFMNATITKDFQQELSGSFEGIGVEIAKRDGLITVVAPLKGSPAEKEGILAGDRIIKINDQDAQNMSLTEAVTLIRGKKDTTVKLTIFRPNTSQTLTFNLVRERINIISCDWQMMENQIALLKIYNFNQDVLSQFYQTAIQIYQAKPKGIILDLRNNPGGYLEAATEISGFFLEKGDIIVKEDFGNGENQKIYRASGNAIFSQTPTVVLINEGTASAAEILAGALADNRQIKIIGMPSFGKGSVQELVPLNQGNSLKITVARWLTPHNKQINEKGIKPDYEVKLPKDVTLGTYEQINWEKDAQLKKAFEILISQIQ